jgi:hypothetical protein
LIVMHPRHCAFCRGEIDEAGDRTVLAAEFVAGPGAEMVQARHRQFHERCFQVVDAHRYRRVTTALAGRRAS